MDLSADQIKTNWDKLVSIIEDTFEGERKEKLLEMYKYFEERMMFAPGSGKIHYHNAFPGGYVDLVGDNSSQYLTSILLSAPYFKHDTTINVIGNLTSKSYADITLDIMKDFGVTVKNESYSRFVISAGQT